MPSETVINLRKQLREQFPAAHRHGDTLQEAAVPYHVRTTAPKPVPTHSPADGAPSSDRQSPPRETEPTGPSPTPLSDWQSREASFPSGAITEISPEHPACGISLLVSTLLASEEDDAPHPGLPLALIDARDQFDPDSFSVEDCRKILWLRCHETQQALQAADLLLRDGNLPRILLDLSCLPPRELQRIPRSSWHRLRQLAESTQATLLALTPTPFIPGTALRLTLTHRLTLADLIFPRRELQQQLTARTTRITGKARIA